MKKIGLGIAILLFAIILSLCSSGMGLLVIGIGIRFGNELMADDCTSIGEFSVLLLIVILSALLVNSYCKKASVVWYIGGVGVGGTLLALLFSFYVIPFDITWFQYGLCVVLLFYLIFLSMHERMRNYFNIAYKIEQLH